MILNIEEANAKITDLEGKLEVALAAAGAASEKAEELEASLTSATTQLDEANEPGEALVAQVARLEGEAKTAEARAADIAAGAGVAKTVTAEAPEEDADTQSVDDIWAEWRGITDPQERKDFYQANRQKLFVR